MRATIIAKNGDFIAFETDTEGCGWLEIIGYDNGDLDIDDVLIGDFSKSGQKVTVRYGNARFSVNIENLGLSSAQAKKEIMRKK